MSQKRNKIIVLVSIVIVIFMSSIYLYNYFFNSDTVILRSIKKCENFLHSNYYVSEENIAYHPSPAVNCVKSKSEVSLIEFNKIDATLKEIKSNQKLIKSINLNAELAIYEQIQRLKFDQDFQIPYSFQLCILNHFSPQNKYTFYPHIFTQSYSHNDLYNFYCSSLLEREKLPDLSIYIEQVEDNDWSKFISYFYLIPNGSLTAEEWSHDINKYDLIFQF